MTIKTVVEVNDSEMNRINIAVSVLQDLEHLYDTCRDKEKLVAMSNAIDVLLEIINDEQ